MLFSRALAPVEVWQTDQYLRAIYGQAWQGESSAMFVLWDGNSISASGVLDQLVANVLGIPPEAMFNFSWGSKTTTHMVTYARADIDPLVSVLPDGKPVVSVGWEIASELGSGSAAAVLAYQHVAAYGAARRALGMKHVTATCLPSVYRDEATRQIANDSVRSHYSLFADALADVASDPNIGQVGQGANTAYYGDGLHSTLLGDTVLAPYFANAVRAVTGSTGVLRR